MFEKEHLHEWLSGGASPCQGEGRGFESRLVLYFILCQTFKIESSGIFYL